MFDQKTAPLSEPEHESWRELSAKERENEALRMEIHAAMVDRMDQNIGRLVKKLEETDKLKNTLILFLVDNGASHERPKRGLKNPGVTVGSLRRLSSRGKMVNSPFKKWKVQGMEGGICTPLIAHWPAGVDLPKNSISRVPCHLIDFFPTFMELAGDEATYPNDLPKLDGVSLKPTFSGKKVKRSDPLFFSTDHRVIRQNQWKLFQKKEAWQLYGE